MHGPTILLFTFLACIHLHTITGWDEISSEVKYHVWNVDYFLEGKSLEYLYNRDLLRMALEVGNYQGSKKHRKLLKAGLLGLTGNVYPTGVYKVAIKLGKSKKSFDLVVDTGSDLTWVICDPSCVKRPNSSGQSFVPLSSKFLHCTSKYCKSAQTGSAKGCKNEYGKKCFYDYVYSGGILTEGFLVQDLLSINSADGLHRAVPFTLGCTFSVDDRLNYSGAPMGILGLGLKDISIPSQLASFGVPPVFGHCFAGGKGGGYLFLGPKGVPSRMAWQPFTSSKYFKVLRNPHYYVDLKNIRLNSAKVKVPSGVLNLDFDKLTGESSGGFKFDSGTTFTYLESTLFSNFEELFLNITRRNNKISEILSGTDPYFSHCWQFRNGTKFSNLKQTNAVFPKLYFDFTKSSLKINPESFMVLTNDKSLCLGVFPSFPKFLGGFSLLGDTGLRNLLFVVDKVKKRYGWQYKDCTL